MEDALQSGVIRGVPVASFRFAEQDFLNLWLCKGGWCTNGGEEGCGRGWGGVGNALKAGGRALGAQCTLCVTNMLNLPIS